MEPFRPVLWKKMEKLAMRTKGKEERMIIFDGQEYENDAEVWDLGSFVCTDSDGDIRHYEGLAADAPAKLPHYVETGSSALCLDTGDYWKFHKPTDTWYQI